jgi:tight adherence protein B
MAAIAAAPAAAGPQVAVTGLQASVGRVEFFVAARELPGGVALERAKITVRAGETVLPSTVRAVASGGRAQTKRGVVLVIDASGSMAGDRLAAARAAAADYAAAAPADVWLGLVTVSSTPTTVLAPTADRARFTEAARRITAKGTTALYDGIVAAEELLDPDENPVAGDFLERRVVVLSDGEDTASRTDVDKLTRTLSRADATVDAVAFGEADRAVLASLTAVTGGEVLPADKPAALRGIFRAMAADLSAPVIVTATVPPALSGAQATLRVAVTAGGSTVEGAVPVRFEVDPTAAAAPDTFRVTPGRPTGLLIAAGALAAALFLGVLLAVLPLVGRSEVRRRLGQLDRFSMGRRAAVTMPDPAGNQMLKAALAVSERAVRKPGRRERMELALDRAGSSLRPAEWLLIRVGVLAASLLLAVLILPWWLGVPVGLLGGWGATAMYMRMRAARRTRRFADQLPDALQLVVGSLRSGFSLPQSIDALVREGADPVAGELGRALAETRLGGDLEDALERVGERNASQDMAWLVMAIRIQREVGGNLSETLETAVATMRERGRLFRHVRALSAEGRLSALVLLGMPIVLGAWMFVFRREYLRPLYTEPLGLLMLIGSVVMVGIGGLWLRKLVRVEV